MAISAKGKKGTGDDPRRDLPSVDELLASAELLPVLDAYGRPPVIDVLRRILAEARQNLAGGGESPSRDTLLARITAAIELEEIDRLRPVVNATGILLHTGLGRAVLPRVAARALGKLDCCCNLQIDMTTGRRGKRNEGVERLLCRLTGAEAALVVNNNAAATLLVLAALCQDREVIVSRGQLIEIGGSYRLPDCIHQSGARMVEVGTTNKTHLRDYQAAITDDTAAILRVNPSNYRVIGFHKSVSTAELAGLKREHPGLLVIDDLGCGALVDMRCFGLEEEPTAPGAIAAGADLVCFSGDKLIGGPQAGLIVGRKDLISTIRRHPLTRMLRVGKLTDAALEATLRLFLDPDTLPATNPTYALLTRTISQMRRKANWIMREVKKAGQPVDLSIQEGYSEVGGGSFPGVRMPTLLLAARSRVTNADGLCAALRRNNPPVISRIDRDMVVMDMRTLLDGEERLLVAALINAHKLHRTNNG